MNDLTKSVLKSVVTNREQNVGHFNRKINEQFGIHSNYELLMKGTQSVYNVAVTSTKKAFLKPTLVTVCASHTVINDPSNISFVNELTS